MSVFKDKVLLITGGTGSFGNAVLRRFLDSDIKEIRIFSRDEKKQDDMRHRLQNSKVKFYIGNVRNKTSVDIAMRGVEVGRGAHHCHPGREPGAVHVQGGHPERLPGLPVRLCVPAGRV